MSQPTPTKPEDPVLLEMPETSAALELRRPATPTTLAALSVRPDAMQILEKRIQTIIVLRKAALQAVFPTDVVLYKAPDDQGGQIIGYIDDAGCDRVRDFFGISVYNISDPVRLEGGEAGVFSYVQRGDGRCNLTGQVVEQIEGGRASTDDYAKQQGTGPALDLAVRKACRANLDGNITRELAGLKSVPIEELEAAWAGTKYRVEQCRKGRGFGSRDERFGANPTRGGAPDVEPPICPVCKTPAVYRPGKDGRGAFYGCKTWEKHKDQKFIINADQWAAKKRADKPAAAETAEPAAPAPHEPVGPPLSAEDIFGSGER